MPPQERKGGDGLLILSGHARRMEQRKEDDDSRDKPATLTYIRVADHKSRKTHDIVVAMAGDNGSGQCLHQKGEARPIATAWCCSFSTDWKYSWSGEVHNCDKYPEKAMVWAAITPVLSDEYESEDDDFGAFL